MLDASLSEGGNLHNVGARSHSSARSKGPLTSVCLPSAPAISKADFYERHGKTRIMASNRTDIRNSMLRVPRTEPPFRSRHTSRSVSFRAAKGFKSQGRKYFVPPAGTKIKRIFNRAAWLRMLSCRWHAAQSSSNTMYLPWEQVQGWLPTQSGTAGAIRDCTRHLALGQHIFEVVADLSQLPTPSWLSGAF